MLEFRSFWMWFAHLFERWPPGVPPDPKKCENVIIFDPNTDIFQVKKASIPLCFLNIFGMKTDDTVQKKRPAFRPVFLNIFGQKTDETVPKNRSEVISQLEWASMPF